MQRNVVAYDEGKFRDLEKKVLLSDALSDLPPVRFNLFHTLINSELAQFDSFHSDFRLQITRNVKSFHSKQCLKLSFRSISGQLNVVGH